MHDAFEHCAAIAERMSVGPWGDEHDAITPKHLAQQIAAAIRDAGRINGRFFYVVRETPIYRGGAEIGCTFCAELYDRTQDLQRFTSCPHNHRDYNRAKSCGVRMVQKARRMPSVTVMSHSGK